MDSDPLSWSVLQVADFFRQHAARYLSDRPTLRLPDLDVFLQALEENEISGDVLLSAVDSAALRDDLGVRSFGARTAVIHCIRKLQELSALRRNAGPERAPQTPNSIVGLSNVPNSDQEPLPAPMPGENVRAGELEVEDGRGKKRRKLDLSALQTVDQTPKSKAQPLPLPANGYMSDPKLTVDELFFGKTAINTEIRHLPPQGNKILLQPNYDIVIEQNDPDPAATQRWHNEAFIEFQYQGKSDGDAAYVYRQMRHFLANDTSKVIERRGRKDMAILPYRQELMTDKKSVSAAVFRIADGAEDGVMAVRENYAFFKAATDADLLGQEQESNEGEWDFLADKYRGEGGSEPLPEFGQSEDDGEMSSRMEREIEEEEEELQRELHGNLAAEEVASIIDDEVNAMTEEWKKTELPRREEKRAWTTWKKMKGSKTLRDQLLESSNDRIRDLNKRLAKLKEEMTRTEWRKEKHVRAQCEAMLGSIEERELERWQISVWNRRKEPHHVKRHGHHQGGGHQGKSDGAANQRVVVHANDRISVSPAPLQEGEMEVDAEPEESPEGSNENQEDQEEEEMDPGDGHSFDGGDEMEDADSPMADWIEPSPPLVLGSPSDLPFDPNADEQATSASPRNHIQDLPDDDSASESETLLPMATLLSQRPKPEPASKATPKTSKSSNSRNQPIEISSDSHSTPASRKKRKKGGLARQSGNFSSNPDDATAAEVESWDMHDLIERDDRRRLLIKLLFDAGVAKRSEILDCISSLRPIHFTTRLNDTVRILQKDFTITTTEDGSSLFLFCAKLYLAYVFVAPQTLQGHPPANVSPSKWIDPYQMSIFVRLLHSILQTHKLFTPAKPEHPSSAKSKTSAGASRVISLLESEEDDEEDSDPLQNTPSKRKQKKPLLSEKGMQSQRQAFNRQDRFKQLQQQSSSQQQLEAMVQADPSRSGIQINIMKEDDDDEIFVDRRIAQDMMDHQVVGVQFMWRELTAGGDDGEAQGCVLAHEQGLGKTVQAIATLVALNEAAQSENPAVYNQLPQSLRPKAMKKRQLRMLVLVPASIVANWRAEFDKWAPSRLPNVFSIDSSNTKDHSDRLEEWYRIGGVVIIGYETFRNKLCTKENKVTKITTDTPNYKFLLKGPEVVIADEAHRMANENTDISLVAKHFKTESRIALTGTPMSNDVQEIYALVSFVAPDYLGDSKWFNAQYARPIKEGNGKDSTYAQQRRAIKKLAVLHRQIEPKVNRADITALKGSLPPKVEFVITLPLTEVQHAAYSKYVQHLEGEGKTEDAAQVTLFGYLAVLTLLTNHPVAFRRKMLSSGKPAARRQARDLTPADSDTSSVNLAQRDNDKDDPDAEAQSVRTSGFSEEAVNRITADINDDIAAKLSTKMFMLMEIIRRSKEIGDKVLVFSHSIPTLDYLGELLKVSRVNFVRIDGSIQTKMREPILKDMQSGKRDVMLMSTKAGGVGLNIQVANRVIILDSNFNPTHEKQAISRSYRLGQTKPVFVYRFSVGGTFEQMLYNKQMLKTGLTARVVDKKNTKRVANVASENYIHVPSQVVQEDLEEHLGKDSILDAIVEEQRQASNGADEIMIRSLETMETLQAEIIEAPLNDEEKLEVEMEFQEGQNTRITRSRKSAAGQPSGSANAPSSTAPAKSKQSQAKNANVRSALPNGINGLPASTQPGLGQAGPSQSQAPSRILKLPNGPPRSTAPQIHGLPMPPPSK